MPSSYSTGTGFELITTGAQAGTWGDSTNNNLKKVDQCLTQYAEVKVSDTTGWSRSDTIDGIEETLTWTLDDTSEALASGSEGRAPFIEFTVGSGSVATAPSENFNIRVKGETQPFPPRFFWARNATAYSIFFYIGTSTTVANCFELQAGDVFPIVTYIDADDVADSYIWPATSTLNCNDLRLIPRTKGILSGTAPEFVIDANSDSNYYGADTVAIGNGAGNPAVGTTSQDRDVIIGHNAAPSANGIDDSVIIGNDAATDLVAQDYNVVIGSEAGHGWASPNNVIIGYNAAFADNTDATGENVVIGSNAAYSAAGSSTSDSNVIIGFKACYEADGVGTTVAIGHSAHYYSSADDNVAVGYEAMKGVSGTTGGATQCVAIGREAMENCGEDGGSGGNIESIAIGYQSMRGDGSNDSIAYRNISIGSQSGVDIQTGADNTMIGTYSGANLTTGDQNVFIGRTSGNGITTQDKNILIGPYVGNTSTGADSILIIDHENQASNQSTTHFIYGDMANDRLNFNSSNASGSHVKIHNTNTAGTGYNFLECIADTTTKFQVRGDGQVQVNGVEVHAADYADMFEWSDGNPEAEDRIGLTVVVDEDSSGGVRPATSSDDPEDVVGAVSGTACMIGNAAWSHWDNKFLKDGFGRVVTHTVDEKPTATINPDFEEGREYIPRMARSDWAVIGMTGRIHIRKGAPVHPSWRKLRDVSAVTEEWLVR